MKNIGLHGFFVWVPGCFLTIAAFKSDSGTVEELSLYRLFGAWVLLIIALPLLPLVVAFKNRTMALVLATSLLALVILLLMTRILIGSYDTKTGEYFWFRHLDVMTYEYAWGFLIIGISLGVYKVWKQ